jgi:hypothetical protein
MTIEVPENSSVAKIAKPEHNGIADFVRKLHEAASVYDKADIAPKSTPGWNGPVVQLYDSGAQTTPTSAQLGLRAEARGSASVGDNNHTNQPNDGTQKQPGSEESKKESDKEDPITQRQTSYDSQGNKIVQTQFENGRRTATVTNPEGKVIYSLTVEQDGSYRERRVGEDGSVTETSFNAKTNEFRSKTTDENGKVIKEEFSANGEPDDDDDDDVEPKSPPGVKLPDGLGDDDDPYGAKRDPGFFENPGLGDNRDPGIFNDPKRGFFKHPRLGDQHDPGIFNDPKRGFFKDPRFGDKHDPGIITGPGLTDPRDLPVIVGGNLQRKLALDPGYHLENRRRGA